MPANRSGGRRLTTHLGPEPQLDRRICARTGQLERDPRARRSGDSRSAIEIAKPRWEADHLMDGEAAATKELLLPRQIPLPCVAEVDQHSKIHRNRRIERTRRRDLPG
jgi:hypothetical protein